MSKRKRPWSSAGLVSASSDGWFASDGFALFMYMDSRDLVLDFKEGHPAAIREVERWFAGSLPQLSAGLRQRGIGYVVAAPGHTPGFARGSAEELCAAIAGQLGATHVRGALRRTKAVTSGYHDGQRSGVADHLATIQYRGPAVAGPRRGIVLFDDVFTSGATSRACRQILTAAGASFVLGLYITKTSAHRAWRPGTGAVRRAPGNEHA